MPESTIYLDLYGQKTGSLRKYSWGPSEDYLFVRNAGSGETPVAGVQDPTIGQIGGLVSKNWQVYRVALQFDTSVIPGNSSILNAKLQFQFVNYPPDTHWDMVIQNGQPDYPHDPVVASDYLHTHYSENGGSINTSGKSAGVYYDIHINDLGKTWINKGAGAKTKILLRSQRDIGAIEPVEGIDERISIDTVQTGRVRLWVEHTPGKLASGKANISTEVIINMPPEIINVKAEYNSVSAALSLYGEITGKAEEQIIVERGFEYKIQDEEPDSEDTGTELKETDEEGYDNGEYHLASPGTYEDLHLSEENTIWWFRAYFKTDKGEKIIAETWKKNVPTIITYECSGAIGTISLGSGGTGYQQYNTINIIQIGASGGTAKVEEVDGEGVIQSISILNRGEDYKIKSGLPVTGGNGTGATINILSILIEPQEITANGELLDKGANTVTERGFRIIKEYEGDLWGIGEYNTFTGWTLEGEIEMETLINENDGSIEGYIWRGTFYRDSINTGDFEVGVYDKILGGGITGEGLNIYLKPNDIYKIRAIAENELGIGFGNDGYFYTYNRLEGGNIGKYKEGKIDIEGEGGEWEEDGEGIWWKADNILQEDAEVRTSIIILPSSEEDEIVSEISAEKTITLGTIPDGAVVTRIGIRLGRTMGCNEIHVFEDGEWGSDESVTFFVTDFVPGASYYKIPYIVINYGDYEEEILAIPDYRDPERLEEWLEDYPIEVFPEVEEEDEDELDQTIIDSSVGDISYRTIVKEIKCERIADQSFIDRFGRRRSQTINNHLIQSRVNCKIIVDDYIEKFQILKLKLLIDYDIPIPFEREDVILLGDGKIKYKEDGQGLTEFKANGEGEILQEDFILTKIRKMDGRYESGEELILSLELEV